MENDENYYSYDPDEEEMEDDVEEEEDLRGVMWGTYAYTPFIDTVEITVMDKQLYATTHHHVVLFYQKEIAIGMGAWVKKPMWDAQEPYVNALHEFWLAGMHDYLAEIRGEKEERRVREKRGLPVIDRDHLRC